MSEQDTPASVYALLADGRTVEIRPTRPSDFDAVKAMHEAMSPDNAYLRFFSLSRLAAGQEARRVTRGPGPDHAALLALFDGQVAGLASFEVARAGAPGGRTAEVAFAVADTMHHRGIATLLLEHLVSAARAMQLTALTAETLRENTGMLRVFSEAGLPVVTKVEAGVVEVTIPLPPDDAGQQLEDYLDTVARREGASNVASLRPVFAPESVAVIGVSRRTGTVGRTVLDNIRSGGYRGALYAVNPHAGRASGEPGPRLRPPEADTGEYGPAGEQAGVPWFPDVASLPEAPELAVLAVPPAAVVETAEACGRRGTRGLVVLTAAVSGPAGAELLAVCRRHGMRLIGPNCFGIAVPAIGLDATFAAANPRPGKVGLVMQSGGLGFAMVDHLTRLGIGISSFASVGNKLDVSSNDLLMWWEQDGVTKVAVLYIESFGNPRKFARTARRVSMKLPVLTVHAGRSAAGARAAASHTGGKVSSPGTREALFEQAGIIATPSFGELMGATALLAAQPPPAGRTVAIVSNVGGAGVLAADACTDLGLTVHRPGAETRQRLRALIPDGGSVNGPVDTAATVSADAFRQVLETLAADEDVHAIIALVLRTGATGDLLAAIAAGDVAVPLAVVELNQPEAVRLIDGKNGRVPSYAYPEVAARALSRAVRYGEWRAAPRQTVPALPGVDAERAREIVQRYLAGTPGGGWLPPDDVTGLLREYAIPLAATPVTGGTKVTIGVRDDHMFGPLVVFGVGALADQAARLAPLTEADADTLIGSVRSAPLLRGYAGAPAADLAALRDILLRVSRLTDDLPEITELDLNPVLARPDGVVVVHARIRVAPQLPQDPFLRRLR
jgi:acyl-CoA synthetase (NDP forming)/GNAT superfamily N-acetyltransferase